MQALSSQRLHDLRTGYKDGLLCDVLPFWLRHGVDNEHGGMLTCLDRMGRVVDTDKAIWLQGRTAWTLSAVSSGVPDPNPQWLTVARSCLEFIRDHARGPGSKLFFTVTREGRPLRMRRYVYSECFAAVGSAAYACATGDARMADDAWEYFRVYLRHSFTLGVMPPKVDAETRPMKALAPLMIGIVTAQELRDSLGDRSVGGATCTQWIDRCVDEIARDFFKPELAALLETTGPEGQLIDHFDGRTLNPGHALECAWFILREAKHRGGDSRLLKLGLGILDAMWSRGWDSEFGGLRYFTDVFGQPVQEYWAEMKFWWPHNEAIIATLMAYQLTGDPRYAESHTLVHEWAHRVFADPEHGEWFGYAHRDGRISTMLKGNLWKGPFHLPRMQWLGWQLTEEILNGIQVSTAVPYPPSSSEINGTASLGR